MKETWETAYQKLYKKLLVMDEKYRLLSERQKIYQDLFERYVCSAAMPLTNPIEDVRAILCHAKHPMLSMAEGVDGGLWKILFADRLQFYPMRQRELSFDLAILWEMRMRPSTTRLLMEAKISHTPILYASDGFLEAVCPPQRIDVPKRFTQYHSLVLDAVGLFTNAHHPSTLENLLNSSRELTTAERARAHRAMEFLRRHRISKYNHQPIHPIHIGTHEKKVLVIDQVWGDSSILYGMSSDEAFEDMLCAAKEEHPDADILIKTHPVANNGFRRRHFNESAAGDGVYFIDYDINPISLLEAVDEVYVCTSQLGFEALMCGKRVHTFGMPFYAGWGLTDDRKSCPRRHRQRTLEDVFYMAYIEYSHYVSYETMQPCEIETAMEELLTLRQEYQDHLDHGGATADLPEKTFPQGAVRLSSERRAA